MRSRHQQIAVGLAAVAEGVALIAGGLALIFIALGLALPGDAAAALLRGLL